VWAGHGPSPDLDALAHDTAAIAEAAIAVFDDGLPAASWTALCVGWSEGAGGLEHRDGAVLQVPVRTFADPELTARFQSLLAHEYLHLWNVKRLVPAALVDPDYERPTHTPSLWVAEGWTAYYDDLLPARAGLWTARRLLDALVETLRIVDDAPGVHLQPLRRASHEAWIKHYIRDENTPNVATDYYAHGAMVAWELDLRLRAADPDGDGLDAVLRLLWRRHAGSAAGYTEQDVLDAIEAVGDTRIAEIADRRAGVAEPPSIDAALLEMVGLAPVERDDVPAVPDLGVRVEDDEQGVRLASVLRGRPAWQAGLTGGDRLVAIDGVALARDDLTRELRTHAPGDTIALTVLRGPRLLTHEVVLGPPRPGWRLVARDDASDTARATFARWTGQTLDALA
jgi:predicted metalloprotease with PDZ domain